MRIFILTLLTILFSLNTYAAQPTNLAIEKKQIRQYVDSGQYKTDIQSVMNEAQAYLATRIAENNKLAKPKKLAIVLDIDETSLSNYPDMIKLSFGGTMRTINKLEGQGHDPAIQPTLALYKFAQKNNVAVFFVTGRREEQRTGTAKNLKAVGFNNYNKLFLKPADYKEKSAAPYKIATRKMLTEQGYTIVLNIGDQQSDLSGGYAEKGYLLPNPFYIVP